MTIMTAAAADEFLYRHDTRARALTRMTRGILADLLAARDQAAGITRWGGAWSKDELVNELLNGEYPVDQLNQAIHAKYHVTGQGGSSACEYCHPHDGGRCDCSPRALEAELARRAAEAVEQTDQLITELSAKYQIPTLAEQAARHEAVEALGCAIHGANPCAACAYDRR